MSVRLSLRVEPVDTTAKIILVEEKRNDKGTWEETRRETVEATTATDTAPFEMGTDTRIAVACEEGGKIVHDTDQNCVTIVPADEPKPSHQPAKVASGASAPDEHHEKAKRGK